MLPGLDRGIVGPTQKVIVILCSGGRHSRNQSVHPRPRRGERELLWSVLQEVPTLRGETARNAAESARVPIPVLRTETTRPSALPTCEQKIIKVIGVVYSVTQRRSKPHVKCGYS